MKEKCIDEGTIQAFLDGELAPDFLERVARHVALCGECAISLAEAEEETAVAFSALELEFNTLVPSQRLWAKINESIEIETRTSLWETILAYGSAFRSIMANPSAVAFASLLIFVGLAAAVWLNRPIPNVGEVDGGQLSSTEVVNFTPPTVDPDEVVPEKSVDSVRVSNERNNDRRVVATKARFVRKPAKSYNSPNPRPVTLAYLPGEESYVKTISTLEKTIESQKDEVLRPSARFEYERDLAITSDAIKKMQAELKKNPKNESAKQILIASYQNKIDLLNAVVSKTELIASIR